MEEKKVYIAIGLMSGTSLDGIDAAIIKTDGYDYVEPLASFSIPYEDELKARIHACLGKREDETGFILGVEREITREHAAAVDWLLSRSGHHPRDVEVIGFHGQTICHDPSMRFTWQIGNGATLAKETGINVVNDFRTADVLAGGEGAPLIPLYHQARAAGHGKPVAILNLGGVGNVTYLGENDEVLAFDTGPGNALINDWIEKHYQREFDQDGLIARQGTVNEELLNKWLDSDYFSRRPPKSLDRDEWQLEGLDSLSAEDGAATLAEFTVQAVVKAREHLPDIPNAWYITGGGRHNLYIMERLQATVNVPVETVEKLGWDGDMLEAEGFAYLAVRSLLGLPLSLPTTTGVKEAMTGGRHFSAA